MQSKTQRAADAPKAIPWSELGARASEKATGNALVVKSLADGSGFLETRFQRLQARVDGQGLRLYSTVEDKQKSDAPLRVAAHSIGRAGGAELAISGQGVVTVAGQQVRWERGGLTEEYSVSVDGVRQDFLLATAPQGAGALRVALAVEGAQAYAAADGARLHLSNGRKLAYTRLHVEDATGKVLPARMEVPAAGQIVLAVEDAGAAYPLRIDPTFSDANWTSMDGPIGINGSVSAIALDPTTGNIYVGGSFTSAGSMAAKYIARWDGSAWSALGSGMDGAVRALAVDGSGGIYAGGEFVTAGGVAANHIAYWNGSAWSALGSGTGGNVYALAVDGSGGVYAGGAFATADGAPANHIAHWNGTAWSALGSGVDQLVRALAQDGAGNLYAGGDFTTAGGATAKYIARWSGGTWQPLGGGVNWSVAALALDGKGNLYAGGWFTTANGGLTASHIARWTGSTWEALLGGPDGNVYALAFDGAGNLYVGGNFTSANSTPTNNIACWTGSTWKALGSGTSSWVAALAVDGSGRLYAGGLFTTAGGVTGYNIAGWDGSGWSALGGGMNGSVWALALDGNGGLYAGGLFTTAGGVTANHVAHWNGSAWSPLGSGMDNAVYALAVDGSGGLYAGGMFTTAGGVTVNHIARWNGSAWSALGSGMDDAVHALAPDGGGGLYAGGFFTAAGGAPANAIAHWNGSAWSALGSGVTGGVYALAVDGSGGVYAGGGGGLATSYIAHWDGGGWSTLGAGMNGTVYALAVDGSGGLYAGGYFTTVGSVTVNRVAHWNGSAWLALGSGMNDLVVALAVDGGGGLYAGGAFTTAGGVTANRIARWNGSGWSPLGSGMNNETYALAVDGNALYAGGLFTTAGGKASHGVARADISVRVSYQGNGQSAGTPPVDTTGYAPGAAITVPGAGSLVRTNYTFSGWNTQADGSGTGYAAGSTLTLRDDVTLYAQWTLNSYTVTASANSGGTITPASRTVNHGSTTTFTVTPDAGYTIVSVTGCGGTLSVATYTTAAITAACAVTAQFGPIFSVQDGAGQALGNTTLASGSTLAFHLANGSGDYAVVAAVNGQGVSGTLVNDGNGDYHFVAPTTGAFAGTYVITITDNVTHWSEQRTLTVPLLVTLSRTTLLSAGERNNAAVVVQGAVDGTTITLVVTGTPANALPTVDGSVDATTDAPQANPARGVLTAQAQTVQVDFEVTATATGYPTGSVAAQVMPATAHSGSLHDFGGNVAGAALTVLDGATGQPLVDELGQPYVALSDGQGAFVLYAPPLAAGQTHQLQASATGYAVLAVDAAVCLQAQGGCRLEMQFATAAEPPVFSAAGDHYQGGVNVTLTSVTPGVTLRYTLDGSTPTPAHGTVLANGQSVLVAQTATLRAMAYVRGLAPSAVTEGAYVIDDITVAGGGGAFSLPWLLALFGVAMRALWRNRVFTFLGASLLLPLDAAAAWYAGASLGRASTDVSSAKITARLHDEGVPGTAQVEGTDRLGWRLFGGYDWNPWLATELGYTDFPEITTRFHGTGPLSSSVLKAVRPTFGSGYELAAVGRYPFTPAWNGFVRAGVFHWRADYSRSDGAGMSFQGDDLFYGIGLERALTGAWSARLSWERYPIDHDNTDFIALGAVYRFGAHAASVSASLVPVQAAPAVQAVEPEPPRAAAVEPPAPEKLLVVQFAFKSARLRREDPAIAEVAERLKGRGERVWVIGHTDSLGDEAYNPLLARARAQAMANALVAHGVERERIVIEGRSASEPLADNATRAGRGQNRRVEVVIRRGM